MPFSFPRSMLISSWLIVSVRLFRGSISLQLNIDHGSLTLCSHSLDCLSGLFSFGINSGWHSIQHPSVRVDGGVIVYMPCSVHPYKSFVKIDLSWNFKPFHFCCPWISTESACLSVTDSAPLCQRDKGFLALP